MIADGDTAVNVVRAERCAALTVTSSNLLKKFPPLRGDTATPVTLEELAKKPRDISAQANHRRSAHERVRLLARCGIGRASHEEPAALSAWTDRAGTD